MIILILWWLGKFFVDAILQIKNSVFLATDK